jgi:ketosteroid isomerase-like protein
MSQETIDVVLGLLDANARRDWDAVSDYYSPGIEWEDTSGLWGDWGVARGHEGVRAAWQRWFETLTDVDWQLDGDLIEARDEVAATYRVHARGRGSGAEVVQRLTLLWSIRDGKVVRVRAYREREQALEALGEGATARPPRSSARRAP